MQAMRNSKLRQLNSERFSEVMRFGMVKLGFYVPATHLEQVKRAVFEAGAGRVGDYDQCAWQTLGQGQFRPGKESDPFVGAPGSLTCVDEYRVQMVCEDQNIHAVISALKKAHPYEEPAYDVIAMLDL